MSLKSFLKDKEVKKKFRDTFPKPRSPIKKIILAPPITKNHPLIGTAFDYLLRFYLKRLNPKSIDGRWVAESAFFGSSLGFGRQWTLAEKILKNAKRNYRAYLKTGEIKGALLKSCLLLAQLDGVFRANVSNNLGIIDKNDILDLKKLISIVDPNLFKAKELCLLNPTFGEASNMVGGADADLVIDDMLIDIKTSKYSELSRQSFDQLIGYYCLYEIGSVKMVGRDPAKLISLPKRHRIRRLAIYYSRFGYLHVMGVKDLINTAEFPSFLVWFKKKASSMFPQRLNTRRKQIYLGEF